MAKSTNDKKTSKNIISKVNAEKYTEAPFPITGGWLRVQDEFIRKRFVYTHDQEENWRSHARAALEDPRKVIRDDCDGLTSTVLELMALKGCPLDRLFRAVVKSPQASASQYIDHMIGLAVVDTGTIYVVGDTFGSPVPLSRCPHKIIQVSCFAWGVSWVDWSENIKSIVSNTPDRRKAQRVEFTKSSTATSMLDTGIIKADPRKR